MRDDTVDDLALASSDSAADDRRPSERIGRALANPSIAARERLDDGARRPSARSSGRRCST